MGVLQAVVSAMKLSGSVFLEAEFSCPWCVTSQIGPEDCALFFSEPAHVISYHYVVEGALLCAVGDAPPVEVRAGQVMLVPRNEKHRLGSWMDAHAPNARDLIQPPDERGLVRIAWGGGGDTCRMFCGFLGTVAPINAFLLGLPSLLVVDLDPGSAGWVASSFEFASTGLSARSPELVGRLAELLFAEAVEQYVDALPAGQTGWLAGLKDPHVSRALALLHTRFAEPLTTEVLAREAGLSRSALAERFTMLIGEPPMRYLGRHRMNVAANLLQESRQNACNVAYAVGFNSEAAFNRAFKKEFGVPPGAWQKARCQPAATAA
ncbi:AraC family transcriptional regulator [Sphingomonas parva]|uniref:AraC family transcriptional regulator n=1 Tax=Sphingomonas parva TaxID=2555898 RepID=A0A4Y8ZVX4_9SPHN|nr:AraC family transcriptional regulator [Sphingomonas parva]TFI60193.1 AraC family transcriptional regulator [Sphingomonas parva]